MSGKGTEKATGSDGPNLYPIKTVVVLVQENRSFDHMLGWMKSIYPDIDGVTGQESNPVDTSDPNSMSIRFGDGSVYVDPDPGHLVEDVYEQVFGEPWSEKSAKKKLPPSMQGFAQNAKRNRYEAVMNGFKPDRVPVYKELVNQFAVCDRWFASVPGPTLPNRLFVHSATSHGAVENALLNYIGGMPQKTIFNSLEEAGLSFGIYSQYIPATLAFRKLRRWKHIINNLHQFDMSFKDHCKEGKLPNYVVIENRYFDSRFMPPANDDHPSHDVSEGQRFVKEVYEALRSSPQWNEILFIITYDEHGGFYDHVPTPIEGVPNPDGIVGPSPMKFNFDRLGVRVPTLLISPWIQPRTVLHGASGPYRTSEYEHSSIPATVKKIFNLKSFLTKRDAWAGTFEGVLTRKTPRTDCPETLPEPVKLREKQPQEDRKLSDFQVELVQLASALRGDHKNIDQNLLVENMTVEQAVEYVQSSMEIFLKQSVEAPENDDSDDSVVGVDGGPSE